ncbi:hypothetical protein KZJ38_07165 [Paraburkholderia edwinii]|uniref:DUF6036 domain-containing protein n=1 Tax=Paraburkholderia edwinii TaxID=2861782 RepID=A0ABX8UML3_9BURK|nr:DUF6036 family nucleotidyltransferase [Paraburkholderia edwinii]QYD70084.1 hypothetical protein KZJ38_07165 [Paraburkholderia edwinii]
MERDQLEHVIRAASAITQETEFVIVGSQSILGAFPDAPESLLQSNELDIYPRVNWERLSDLIDGSIGEGSPFNQTYGYYAQGVDPRTAVLPVGWEGRLTQVATPATGGGVGYCIDVHDLALSKYVADRPKDRAFNRELIRHGMVDPVKLRKRVDLLPVGDERKTLILSAIDRDEKTVAEAAPPQAAAAPERFKP